MFSYLCILAAAVMAAFSVKEYRQASIIVALEFALHKLAFEYGFVEMRQIDGFRWILYGMYASINLLALAAISRARCHFFIAAMLTINMLFNLAMLYKVQNIGESITYYDEFMHLYEIYPYFVGTIMILELTYLGWLISYVEWSMRSNNNADIDRIDRLFYIHRFDFLVGRVS